MTTIIVTGVVAKKTCGYCTCRHAISQTDQELLHRHTHLDPECGMGGKPRKLAPSFHMRGQNTNAAGCAPLVARTPRWGLHFYRILRDGVNHPPPLSHSLGGGIRSLVTPRRRGPEHRSNDVYVCGNLPSRRFGTTPPSDH